MNTYQQNGWERCAPRTIQQYPQQQQQQQQQPMCPQISPTGLPMNWDMGVDPQSGKTFYINKSQGRTFWSLPQDLPPNWEVNIDMGTNKLFYIDHSTKTTHWEYPYSKVVSMLTNGNNAGGVPGKPEFSCDEEELTYSDPRVEELVAIGISRGSAVAAAKMNPAGTANDLIELILIKAKQNGHDIKLLSSSNGKSSDGSMCIICMSEPADSVILECKHMCTCSTCSKRLVECPMCRSKVKGIMKIFLNN